MSRLVLSIDGFVGRTVDPQIKIATIPGEIVGSTLPLGSSWIYKAGLSGDYAITRSLHVNAGVEWAWQSAPAFPAAQTPEHGIGGKPLDERQGWAG